MAPTPPAVKAQSFGSDPRPRERGCCRWKRPRLAAMSQPPPPGSAPRGPAPRGLHRRACVSGLGAGLGTRARASPPWERPQLSGALLGTLTQCSGDLVAAHQVWMSCWPAETSHIELAVRPPHPCGYKIGGNGKQRPTAPSLRAVASAADTSGQSLTSESPSTWPGGEF